MLCSNCTTASGYLDTDTCEVCGISLNFDSTTELSINDSKEVREKKIAAITDHVPDDNEESICRYLAVTDCDACPFWMECGSFQVPW